MFTLPLPSIPLIRTPSALNTLLIKASKNAPTPSPNVIITVNLK